MNKISPNSLLQVQSKYEFVYLACLSNDKVISKTYNATFNLM